MSVATSPRPLKRDHDNYESGSGSGLGSEDMIELRTEEAPLVMPAHLEKKKRELSPARSAGSLTGAGSTASSVLDHLSIPASTSTSTSVSTSISTSTSTPPTTALPPVPPSATPSASAATNGNPLPQPKKSKMTPTEREEKRILKEIKDREKAKKDAEREEKRLKREEERRKVEEEKSKKERSQLRLNNFFAIPAPASKPRDRSAERSRTSESPGPSSSAHTAAAVTPSRPELSTYDKIFPGFFLNQNVSLAPINRFERDEEGSRLLQDTIDTYISGNRSPGRERPFDATNLFHLSQVVPRGRRYTPVRQLILEIESGNSKRPIDLTSESQQSQNNSQTKTIRDLLRQTPLKILHFAEDVRPPYKGTYTKQPTTGMHKLARNPMRRDLPDTNYEYDSEAEWVEGEDDADADDVNSEDGDDEDLDDDEDMDGFLDDENDDLARERRVGTSGDLEPISTGLCWEDGKKRNANVKMVKYRMENILDPTMKSIDPFSTTYWQPPSTSMPPPRLPLTITKPNSLSTRGVPSSTATTSKPPKPFYPTSTSTSTIQVIIPPFTPLAPASASASNQTITSKKGKEVKLIPQADMQDFKDAVRGSDLTKIGLVETLKRQFPGRGAASIKATLELVAKRVGAKEVDKRWVLNEEAT